MDHEKKPQIIGLGLWGTQVCVPEDYTDFEAIEISVGGLALEIQHMKETGFWEKELSPETRKLLEGHCDPSLYRLATSEEMDGDPQRVPCKEHEGMVHAVVVLKDDPIRMLLNATR